jgi:hypothetical protein
VSRAAGVLRAVIIAPNGRRSHDATVYRFTTVRGRKIATRQAMQRIMRRNYGWTEILWTWHTEVQP